MINPFENFGDLITQMNTTGAAPVPFNPSWSNGTGYYDKAVKDDSLNLAKGEIGYSHDPDTDRRLLFLGTRFGNVVVFERFRFGSDTKVNVGNMPGELVWFGVSFSGGVCYDTFNRLFGYAKIDERGKWVTTLGLNYDIELASAYFKDIHCGDVVIG